VELAAVAVANGNAAVRPRQATEVVSAAAAAAATPEADR